MESVIYTEDKTKYKKYKTSSLAQRIYASLTFYTFADMYRRYAARILVIIMTHNTILSQRVISIISVHVFTLCYVHPHLLFINKQKIGIILYGVLRNIFQKANI